MQQIYNSFMYLAKEMQMEYVFSADTHSIFCMFDHDKLDKIIWNLLSNAFKYTGPNGKIELRLSRKEVQENDVHLQIEISDTGRGIPEDQINYIFDRFYQVNDQNKEAAKIGTGIGLALTKEMVEIHKGTIQVESSENKGTLFRISLPLQFEPSSSTGVLQTGTGEIVETADHSYLNEPTPTNDSERNDFPLEKKTLLVVEDVADVRFFIKNELEDLYHIEEASNGLLGKQKALELIPDLILSDVMMPEMSGFELCDYLKKDERTNHIPILLLTAKTSEESQLEGIHTGADDYITKPFSSAILKAKIAGILKSRKLLKDKYQQILNTNTREIKVESVDEKFLVKSLEIVNEKLSEPLFGVEEFASEMHMSRVQLFRKLKALTNTTPVELIKNQDTKTILSESRYRPY